MVPLLAHNTKKCESITEVGSSKSRVRHAALLPSFLNSVEGNKDNKAVSSSQQLKNTPSQPQLSAIPGER